MARTVASNVASWNILLVSKHEPFLFDEATDLGTARGAQS
jgi:hypothetical protein